jgi:hypothetical protein
MSRFLSSYILFIFCQLLQGQNTIGVLTQETNRQEYNLFFPFTHNTVYLIDNCGRLINSWSDEANVTPGPASYLMPTGDLLVTKAKGSTVNDTIRAGGAGEFIEIRGWDNTLKFQFRLNNGKGRLHHDVKSLPNGNILAIAWENFTPAEAISNGRRPDLISENALWPDYLIEINPQQNKIVWEWHAWDHLIQDHDSTKANYGAVQAHPELIDINYISTSGQADWMHSNGVDYNPELDIIALSVSHFNEVWFIDHSVTTSEARGHNGGKFGKGGDLLYRWGNPLAYKKGGPQDQKLNFQHDIRFIKEGKYKGCVSVFNNRFNTAYSSCSVIRPKLNSLGNRFEIGLNNTFLPADYEANFLHPVSPDRLRSSALSSFQLTPQDHIFSFSGNQGYAVEFDEKGKIYWEYILPFSTGQIQSQGAIPNSNLAFKMEKYQADFSGFKGKDMTPKGYLEINPNVRECILVGSKDFKNPTSTILKSNFSIDGQLNLNSYQNFSIYDLSGRMVEFNQIDDAIITIPSIVPNGVYFIKTNLGKVEKFLLMR